MTRRQAVMMLGLSQTPNLFPDLVDAASTSVQHQAPALQQ
jgi:hypothetical protein